MLHWHEDGTTYTYPATRSALRSYPCIVVNERCYGIQRDSRWKVTLTLVERRKVVHNQRIAVSEQERRAEAHHRPVRHEVVSVLARRSESAQQSRDCEDDPSELEQRGLAEHVTELRAGGYSGTSATSEREAALLRIREDIVARMRGE